MLFRKTNNFSPYYFEAVHGRGTESSAISLRSATTLSIILSFWNFVCSITADFIKEKVLFFEKYLLSIKSWTARKIQVLTEHLQWVVTHLVILLGEERSSNHSLSQSLCFILTCNRSKTRPTTLKDILSTSSKLRFSDTAFQVALSKNGSRIGSFPFLARWRRSVKEHD